MAQRLPHLHAPPPKPGFRGAYASSQGYSQQHQYRRIDLHTDSTLTAKQLADARAVLADLQLEESGPQHLRPVSGHRSSLLLPCNGANKQRYLLKFFIPPAESCYYPAGVRIDDYARREGAFYRYLDSTDPGRIQLPAPRTIVLDSADPPRWILLEWIPQAVGPVEEVLSMDHVFNLVSRLQSLSLDRLFGRRDFPLNHWTVVSYLERVRMMYDPVLKVIGDNRWRYTQDFFVEALNWIETRPPTLVHGDFTEQNILVDEDGKPFLVDFERIGFGSEDHDIAWLWIHSERPHGWKISLMQRFFGNRMGSQRIMAEWGIRSALVYLALRRLRFGFLISGHGDQGAARNLALLDAALVGGVDLFPA